MPQLSPPLELSYPPVLIGPNILPPDCTAQYPNLTNGQLPINALHLVGVNGYSYDSAAALLGGLVDITGAALQYDLGPFSLTYARTLVLYMAQFKINDAGSMAKDTRFAASFRNASLKQIKYTEDQEQAIVSITIYTDWATL